MRKAKIALWHICGGYRATAYQLGPYRKLNQLIILNKTEFILSISSGSITGAI